MTSFPPRLLFLCQTLPYPPDGGVWIRSYHLLRQLSQEFKVTALCFERTGRPDHDVDEAVRRLSDMVPTEAYPVPQDESLERTVADHLRSLLSGRVFTVYKHRSRDFRQRLLELIEAENFELVHMDSLDLSTYLPLLKNLPVAVGHHNVESQLFKRRADAETNPLVRWYLRLQSRWQRQEEERWCDQVDLNVVVSENDRETLTELQPHARIEVVPNGVDVEAFSPAESKHDKNGIIFVGGAGWFPNRDGMEYFARTILPRIRRRLEDDVAITWVGIADDELRRRFEREYGVQMTGYVEDVRPYVREAACFVVPLRVGGGSRLKILDAWAMGAAVVSTAQGCEGLDARDGKNILVRDDPERFADAVARVLKEPDLRTRLGGAARETAVESYSWEKIGEEMNRAYRSLID